METPGTSLILTKLRPPVTRSRVVARERLLQRLAQEPGADLVLICAPAGYGKTTLLVEWSRQMQQSGTAVAWVSLDESDNSPLAFGAYVLASLKQALGDGSGLEPIHQVLRASAEPDLVQVFSAVINALLASAAPVLLVLDDYHLIRAPAVHRAVGFLVSRRPENLRVAVGSRANPPLPLARLRARGGLIELRAPDLRFTEEETGQFLRQSMQLDLPGEQAVRLSEQVEGWAAGLQLAAISLSGRPVWEDAQMLVSGQHSHLAEYMLDEVVNQLPEAVQSFLLYTSILERMSAPLCDAILGIHDSADQLARLEQANLFVVALDEQGIWFRYHHLFRDFLRAWLSRTQPQRARELHRAASAWYAGQGLLREAAQHAFRAEDWEFAADFVERHSFTLIIHSEIAVIYEWCAAFPEAFLRQRPMLCIFQGLALAYRFQDKNRARVEARLRQADDAPAGQKDAAQALGAGELAAVVRTFLAMIPDRRADARRQLELAQSRLSFYPPQEPGRFPWLLIAGYAHLALNEPQEAAAAFEGALPFALDASLYFGFVEASFHLARLAHSQGRLRVSLEICQKAGETITELLQPQGLALPALGCLDVAAGCVLLEQGNFAESAQRLRLGLERMGWGINPYYLMTAFLAQFRLNEIQGKTAEALAGLDQLESLWPDLRFLTQGCRARARLRASPNDRAALDLAREWLQTYIPARGEDLPLLGLGPIGAAEAFYQADLIWMQLCLATGISAGVWASLAPRLQLARENGLVGREIEWMLIHAQLLAVEGQQEQALAVLDDALAAGRACGSRSVFQQSAALDDLLHRAALRGSPPAELGTILSIARGRENGPAAAPGQMQPPLEPLSARELDVLRMIAAGATNQEIARRLVITVGTVKSHINHIFGKLDAGNRTEAVALARQMGLLDD